MDFRPFPSIRPFPFVFLLGLLTATATVTASESDHDYPSKPIRMLVGATAGGGSDQVARIVAAQLSKRLGQQVVVENRPGAGGNIANLATAHAPADGYTLAMAYSGLALNPAVMSSMPFDTRKELATVSQVADVPMGLVVNASTPARSIQELVGLAKSQPGQLSFGVNALASVGHLSTELFKQRTGVDMPVVVYKGSSAAMIDLLNGTVVAMFDTIASAAPQVKGGRLRMLAVGGAKRMPSMPEVPTLAEAGLEDFDLRSWYGVIAPAGTPDAIIRKLGKEIGEVMKMTEVREQFARSSLIPVGSTPEEFRGYLDAELKRWDRIAKSSGIKVQ